MTKESSTEFNLGRHVAAILAESAEEDLGALCDLIFRKTRRTDMQEAYRQALPHIVRQELSRGAHISAGIRQAPTQDHNASTDPGGQEGVAPAPAPAHNLRNSRVARFRRNAFRITIGIGGNRYRHILDCTREDLEFAAAESHRLADSNRAAAHRYEKLLKVMREHGAEKVEDLTDEQISEVLNEEPAEKGGDR